MNSSDLLDSRYRIVYKAQSFVGTPFHQGASLPGVGMDCIGILKAIIDAFDLPVNYKNSDIPKYFCQRDYITAKKCFDRLFARYEFPVSGSIVLRKIGRLVHCGIITGSLDCKLWVNSGIRQISEDPYNPHTNDVYYQFPGVRYLWHK